MSSQPEAMQNALDFLKGKDNPFASLARPQRLDDYFLDLHVPQLLQQERQQLWKIIDHFRVAEYTRTAHLPATGVITILGDRGAGKTHLLQSLSYREDGQSQILVRPSFFDIDRSIEEYLLSQLVATLLAKDEVYGSRPIEDLAAALTRRLLRQALRSLGPTDRLCARMPSRWQRWRLLLGGGNRICQDFERLAASLEQLPATSELGPLIRKFGLDEAQCFRLLLGHLQRFETGPDLLALLRRALYTAMARSVLFHDSDALFRFLEGEYTQIGSEANSRSEVVNRMLHAVTEMCALVRQPIVFAFDNLERLFNPQNQFDEKLVRAFWSNLAQAIDYTKGLLLLLFIEKGLLQRASSFMDAFAQDRIVQGVPVFGQGPVQVIELKPPRSEEILALIEARVGSLLKSFAERSQLPAYFPFQEGFLAKAGSADQVLRVTLTRLRDDYSGLVYQQVAASKPEPVLPWDSVLEGRWNDQFAAAGPKMIGSLAAQRSALHAGLGSLLQRSLPLELQGWTLGEIQPTTSIGDNPTYGVVSVLHWQRAGSAGAANGAGIKLGVGFLLASGTGMAPDLKAKLDFFRRPAAGNHLLILWPGAREADDLVAMLPEKTRAVWDDSRCKKKMTLYRIELNDLRALLTWPDWLNSLPALTDRPVPPEVVRAFTLKHFEPILQMLLPPVANEERTAANED